MKFLAKLFARDKQSVPGTVRGQVLSEEQLASLITSRDLERILEALLFADPITSLELSIRCNFRHMTCSAAMTKSAGLSPPRFPIPSPGLLIRQCDLDTTAQLLYKSTMVGAFLCNMCRDRVAVGIDSLRSYRDRVLFDPPEPGCMGYEGVFRAQQQLLRLKAERGIF
ncbi:MAG TPA: hypothetical protein VEW48_27850 [Thermoanaerobaculia bacterium]|nr:hypothetical protein [Thermoanaerobaculia bacterium]